MEEKDTPKSTADCAGKTDADIVKAVMDGLAAAFPVHSIHSPVFKDDTGRIFLYITCKDAAVTLRGLAKSAPGLPREAAKTKVTAVVQAVSCVTSVIANGLAEIRGPGCGEGQKKCGEACIGVDEPCPPMGT
ncbi:MAG: hypothetical protein HYR56_33080 [Acidobacteria bacterium]|nr:hypothetical protein [Acidobacteriota bacterium]MBI3422115.1 hypothetical protein [Acidobacteriota bacterium]